MNGSARRGGIVTFEVGDRVKIVSSVFEGGIGTVVKVIPGRTKAIEREYVVDTAGELHTFFADQLSPMNDPA
jgi:hypothetical protein